VAITQWPTERLPPRISHGHRQAAQGVRARRVSGLRRKEVQLVSQLFNLNAFYDRLAPAYAAAMEVAPVWRRYTEAVLPHLPDSGAVLEVGPGPGLLLARLSARYPLAVGLDRSSGMLRQAGRRLIRSRLPVRLSRGDATILPIASGSFDATPTLVEGGRVACLSWWMPAIRATVTSSALVWPGCGSCSAITCGMRRP